MSRKHGVNMNVPKGGKTAIVVGAGVGGVATAARLAQAGFQVTVVEKNEFTGGRCSLLHHEGYRFDQGPSLLLLPSLFHETFRDLGTSLAAEGVDLLKCEPNYHIWFSDGERFELSTDLVRMRGEIERWEGVDGFERYLQFLQESHHHHDLSIVHVLRRNFASWFDMLRPGFLRHIIALHPLESLYARASRYFWTDRLRRVFTFASMYMGMSPFDAPGTYSLLQYAELAEGIWYPRGGFHTVVQALVALGERAGVEYRLGSPVDRVLLSDNGRSARGVVLAGKNGGPEETLTADVVVINADLVYAYENLLPASATGRALKTRSQSCSSISFYWAMNRCIPELTTHNIFLADKYQESFDDIFKRQRLPEQPSFYVNVPSRIDPTAAPKGKDVLTVLVPVGHLVPPKKGDGSEISSPRTSTDQDWPGMVNRARSTILETIEARTGCVKLKGCIAHEEINTPISWQERFNLEKGSILGLSHSFFNVLSFRPANKHAKIKGCYFVGASTHPGTGVPVCLAGGKVVAEQILQDRSMPIPWRAITEKKQGIKDLDRIRTGSNGFYYLVVLIGFVMMLWMTSGIITGSEM